MFLLMLLELYKNIAAPVLNPTHKVTIFKSNPITPREGREVVPESHLTHMIW